MVGEGDRCAVWAVWGARPRRPEGGGVHVSGTLQGIRGCVHVMDGRKGSSYVPARKGGRAATATAGAGAEWKGDRAGGGSEAGERAETDK